MILTKRKIQRRGLYGLQFPNSVVHQQYRGQTPANVNVQVTMQKPGTWVISDKSNNCPSIYRHSHSVPQRWIDKVEFLGIFLSVKIPEPLGNDVEIIAMKMNGVVLRSDNASILQHNLHPRPKLQLMRLRPGKRLPQRPAHVSGVVELHRRPRGKVGGEDAGDGLVVGLQDGDVVGEHEGDVVDAGRESGSVGPLAPLAFVEAFGALVQAQAHREEEAFVHFGGDFDSSRASEPFAEGCDGVGVVECGERGHEGFRFGGVVVVVRARVAVVVEDGGRGGVVEGGVLGRLVGAGGDVVAGGGLVGGEEDVGGLAGAQHEDFGGEGFQVRCVGANHCEFVVCHREEEGLVQCSVYHTKEVRFARVYWDDGRVFARALVKITRLTIDGVCIGHVWSSPCSCGLPHNIDRVCVPPFPKKNGCLVLWLGERVGFSFPRTND